MYAVFRKPYEVRSTEYIDKYTIAQHSVTALIVESVSHCQSNFKTLVQMTGRWEFRH